MTVLSEILGHNRVLNTLVAANANGTVHHALLFAGPDGVGKATVARALSALMNCTGQAPVDPEGRPVDACGTCRSCRRILAEPTDGEVGESSHPDLLALRPDGKTIKIGQVREILKVLPYPPLEARVRVVVIDPAEAMTVPAANALLKTLEEPPSSTQFILVSSQPDALLTTIRSRCQRIGFGRLRDEEVIAGLERHSDARGESAEMLTSMA
ncbi:MAG: DNA polymerase III subunit delta', partial [Myxococcota bacterium]|nr:DNA polymerase III subunit delta' [Myxococcota bacterium]